MGNVSMKEQMITWRTGQQYMYTEGPLVKSFPHNLLGGLKHQSTSLTGAVREVLQCSDL